MKIITSNKFSLGLILGLSLIACSPPQEEVIITQQKKQEPLSNTPEKKEITNPIKAKAKPFSFREENIDDPSFYDKPRLQFLWKPHFANPGRQSIWSMKIDGTDLARVVSIKWLYEGDWQAAGRTRPVRSPDNRYIAVMQYYNGDPASRLRLIDLKNKTSESITELWGDSSFNWSADSQTLYFRKDSWITSYHLPTKQFKKIYKTYANPDATRLVFNKTALAIPYKNKLKIIDLKGNLLQEVLVKSNDGYEQYIESISDDGSILMALRWDTKLRKDVYSVRSLTEPNKELFISDTGHNFEYSPYNKYELFTSSPSIYNFKTDTYTRLYGTLPDARGAQMSLYNLKAYKKDSE